MLNERQILYMQTILQEGSITKAAEKLYISQPSLSQMVRKIEDQIGAELFERYTNPIVLTPAGECYFRAIREIQHTYDTMLKEIQDIDEGVRGKLRLGLPVQRALEVIPYFYPVFHAKYPYVELKTEELGSADLEEMLINGDLDIAFLTTEYKVNELNYILVKKEEIVLLAAKTTDLAQHVPNDTPISIKDAFTEKFIGLKSGHSVRIIQEQLFALANPAPEIIIETTSIEVAKRAVPACNAVFLCPRNYIDISPELYLTCNVYPVKDADPDRHFYIAYRKDQHLTKYMKDLIELFVPSKTAE